MADNAKTQHKPLIAYLDYFVFVKNGYSVWKHLVPFAIAALLLIILSIPTDNLLLKLADLLQEPNLLWLPAGLLTVVSTIVYLLTIRVQICQAYLWSDGDRRRTIGTSLAFIILCTLMSYAVLWSVSSDETRSLDKTTFGNIWASYLLAILSLTGIGWSGPNSWVESIGIKSPDYTDGRLAAAKLTDILRRVRNTSTADIQDVQDFSTEAKNLCSSIKKNRELEPIWERDKLKDVIRELRNLLDQVKKFLTNDKEVKCFAAACKYGEEHWHKEFIETLKTLSNYWCEWKYKVPNK